MDADEKQLLNAALHSIDELDRLIVRMRWVEGFSAVDIAECLALDADEVDERVQRSVQLLKNKLRFGPLDVDAEPLNSR